MNNPHPEHWTPVTGPANWYTLWYPPSWELNERDGHVRLQPPSGKGSLSLNILWQPNRTDVDPRSAVELSGSFARHRNIRSLRPLSLPYPSAGVVGEAQLGPAVAWWKRWLLRSSWTRWMVWSVRQAELCLMAIWLSGDVEDRESESVATMILNTLVFAERPAVPPNVFVERVLELVRERFPLIRCERGDEFQLKLGESKLNLFNFYRTYVNQPENFEEIMLPAITTIIQVQGWGAAQKQPDLRDVIDRILPMLYPEAVWQESFPNFAGQPWIADLTTLYVVDESHAYWYVRNDLVEKWGLSLEELHDIALGNLNRYFDDHPMELAVLGDDDGARVLMPNSPDAYNSSRVLSNSFHSRLREMLGEQCVVGVPSRDFFVACEGLSSEMIKLIRQRVAIDFTRMDHPLTDRLLLISADGVSEFWDDERAVPETG